MVSPDAGSVPPYRYTAVLAAELERRWQDRWEAEGTFETANPVGALVGGVGLGDRPKLYLLDMFPYPSAYGLHVGHPLGYIGTDVYGRYRRMAGWNVLHTLGFDAFGLPAEQYAVQRGQHPRTTTESNVANYRRQLRRLGLAHDPRRSVTTTDPAYYRWTQWIFAQIFDAWYDLDAGRARPITELVDELAIGNRPTADGRAWADLSALEQQAVIDGHRLAYLADGPVNWCPGLGTVLANEEVTADGRSDIGNFPVFHRTMRQWMLRITAYADRLLDDLDALDWPESIKTMQRNWIGRSDGARIRFSTSAGPMEVFTTRPDTVFGATFVVLAPEHPLVDVLLPPIWPADIPQSWRGGANGPAEAVAGYRHAAASKTDRERQESRVKTGVFTGAVATNPATGASIPVFIADYVLMGYGTGAIMGVPGQDERDWEFAEAYDLPIVRTVQSPEGFEGRAYNGDGPAINSGFLDGLDVATAKQAIIDWLTEHDAGEPAVTYKLRDWLFSRQRYWGEPFPIVYDEDGRPLVVPAGQLPVQLPDLPDFRSAALDPDDDISEPVPPLARAGDWVTVELDLGEGPRRYRRELNVMPQWAGSCWYELRYLDPINEAAFCDPEVERYWMGPRNPRDPGGVDLYVGGVEHAVLHLLYARFWHKVLYDLGHVSSWEPYRRLYNQGYIQAYAYRDQRGQTVEAAEVTETVDGFRWRGQPVRREFGKMGKSLKNSVNPDELYAEYGADTFRLYEMSMAPLDASRPWETRAVVGMFRFLQRLWRNLIHEQSGALRVHERPADDATRRLLHRTIAGVREDLTDLRFNTAVAKLITLNNHLTGIAADTGSPREVAEPLVLMIAPFTPHIAEELWTRLGHLESLAYAAFPTADPALIIAEQLEYPVQVNGKVRARLRLPADAEPADLQHAALQHPRVVELLAGTAPRKIIVVPGRLVSIVV
ncbi:MAG TPA: leucine--tRNA ligase [Propionibacteriaceae bacterium]|nr:leucine--tRNA ligase [Propionibacteriaceae bacterium]